MLGRFEEHLEEGKDGTEGARRGAREKMKLEASLNASSF